MLWHIIFRQGGGNSSAEDFNFRCDEVDAADAEASLTERVKASSLRVNGYVMLSGNPCKVVSMSVSKPGKHGHAKIHMFGVDVFTLKKYEGIVPTTQNIEVPVTSKKDYLVSRLMANRKQWYYGSYTSAVFNVCFTL